MVRAGSGSGLQGTITQSTGTMPELGPDVKQLTVLVENISPYILHTKIGAPGRWEVPRKLFLAPNVTGALPLLPFLMQPLFLYAPVPGLLCWHAGSRLTQQLLTCKLAGSAACAAALWRALRFGSGMHRRCRLKRGSDKGALLPVMCSLKRAHDVPVQLQHLALHLCRGAHRRQRAAHLQHGRHPPGLQGARMCHLQLHPAV